LLFWKEVERYKYLTSTKERKAIANKILETYIKSTSPRYVNLAGQAVNKIETGMRAASLPADLFDEAQADIYDSLRLELYPRFLDEVNQLDKIALNFQAEQVGTSLEQVLKGTSEAVSRHFERFAREFFLEEGLVFWQEAEGYKLLFSKGDMHTKAKEIYDQFMSATSSCKVNVSDATIAHIHAVVTAPLDQAEIDSNLFTKAQKEIETYLELDVWARYLEWAKTDGKIDDGASRGSCPPATRGSSRISAESLQWRDGSQSANDTVAQLLQDEQQLHSLRRIAREVDGEEAIDFYLEAKEFGMLFSQRDLRDRSKRIWMRYLDDQADRQVNLPSSMVKALKKAIVDDDCANVDVKLFDKANKEILKIIADNIYPAWVKQQDSAEQHAKATPAPPGPTIHSSSRGTCCVIS